MKQIFDKIGFSSCIDFDQDGPRIGQVRLLRKTSLGFIPRSGEEIEELCRDTYGVGVDAGNLEKLLPSIASALNVGDVALAAIATGRLPLRMRKASVDDPKHPGYPAKEPGGKGGQFRPKDAPSEPDAKTKRGKLLIDIAKKRELISTARRVLSFRRVLKMIMRFVEGEAVQDIPVVNDIVGAASFADDVELLNALAEDSIEGNAAAQFATKGPYDLHELQRSPDALQSFETFDAFKKTEIEKQFGPAGDGYDYHHLVEQGPNANVFPASQINSTDNIIRLPRWLHEEISADYSRLQDIGGILSTPRAFLRGKSFEEQRAFGISRLRDMGLIH